MSRKLSPQGRAGRKYLRRKIEVECIEAGCTRKLRVNSGNAAKGVRCEEHRKAHLNKKARERKQARRVKELEDSLTNRLAELRSFKTWVKCRNDFCDTLVETNGLYARHPRGIYCDDCRREANQIYDRNYYARRGKFLRQQRQEEDAA